MFILFVYFCLILFLFIFNFNFNFNFIYLFIFNFISILFWINFQKGLLNGNVLDSSKTGLNFINVGRGSIIDENVIIEQLEKKNLGHVVLDVFNTEPLPLESKLWTHERVFVTPHVSAESQVDQVAEVFVQNVLNFTQNKPLIHQVDWEKGY